MGPNNKENKTKTKKEDTGILKSTNVIIQVDFKTKLCRIVNNMYLPVVSVSRQAAKAQLTGHQRPEITCFWS